MKFDKLTAYLDSLEEKYGIRSVDCQVTKDHEIIYRHMHGHCDYDGKVDTNKDNLYRLYSATKVITMISVMQLIEQGKLDFYGEVRKYLPEFGVMRVADDFKMEGFPIKWPDRNTPGHLAHNAIRIIDLMSMTAGMSYDITSDEIKEIKKSSGNKANTREVVAAIARMTLLYEPATRWSYSLAHDVLAAVVEVVSGQRFSEYLNENIFNTLEVKDFYFKLDKEQRDRLCAQYAADFKTKVIGPVPNENNFQLTEEYESGGAGLAATVDAYSTIIDALSCGGVGRNGKRILRQESVTLFTQSYTTGIMQDDFKLSGKIGYGYGLGVRVLKDAEGSKSPVGEFGWDGAAGAYVVVDPISHISIFYVQQVLGFIPAYDIIHPTVRELVYEGLK